jgi:hypothetical protein
MSSADSIAAAAPSPEPEPVPKDAFSRLIDQATSRLGSDSDLRLEIAQELHGHLQDSAAEYRAAGLTEAEAQAKAAEAMGDPIALADQLWQANRGRIRRRAIAAWAFGVLAAPVGVAVCFSLVWGVVTSLSLLTLVGAISTRRGDSLAVAVGPGPARQAWKRLVERVRPEDRILIGGEDAANLGRDFRVTQARAAAERWPDDPLYAANYVTQSLLNPALFKGPEKTDRAALQELIRRADRGAAVEPYNGYYALIKAAALMDVSARVLDEPYDRKPGYDYGQTSEMRFDRIEVLDPPTFEQGLAAFREAARKPFIDSHAMDVARRQAEHFPVPTELSDYLLQTSFTISTLLPHLNDYRRAGNLAGGYAITLAERGDAARAQAIVADERRAGLLEVASASLIIESLVGQGMRSQGRAHEVVVEKLLGRTDASARALAALRAEKQQDSEVRHAPTASAAADRARRGAGLIQSATLYDVTRSDLTPGRRAEYAAADELALSVLTLTLLLAAGARAALIGASAIARRRSGQPAARPFIGWRRVARIVLLGGVLPVSLYGAYCYLPISGRGYGLPRTGPRVVLEYAVVAAVVAFLLRRLTERAVHRRLTELGLLTVSIGGARWAGALGLLAAIALVVGVFAWQVLGAAGTTEAASLYVALPLALAVGAAAFAGGQLGDLRMPAFRAPRRDGSPPAKSDTPKPAGARPSSAAGSLWTRPYPGSIVGMLAVLTGVCLWLAIRDAPHQQAAWQTRFAAAAVACGASMLGLAAFRFAAAFRRSARTGRHPDAARPLDTPAALQWRALARSAAVTYAATALVVGGLGAAVLRAQERRAVGQFDQAGYNFFDELQRSRYHAVRDRAVAELRESPPSTVP